MIKIQEYKVGDIGKISPMPGAFDTYAQHDLSLLIDSSSRSDSINVFTVSSGEKTLAVICWYFLWDGVVELLALTDKEIKKSPIKFAKVMKEWIDQEIAMRHVVRVQTTLRATYPEGKKWLSFLGMAHEGTMKKFCPDKSDCELWARVE